MDKIVPITQTWLFVQRSFLLDWFNEQVIIMKTGGSKKNWHINELRFISEQENLIDFLDSG